MPRPTCQRQGLALGASGLGMNWGYQGQGLVGKAVT